MSKREGPKVTIKASCFDCAYEHSEHYAVQGDSGCDVYCTHPDAPGERAASVGDTTWTTPQWCPFLKDAGQLIKLLPRCDGSHTAGICHDPECRFRTKGGVG